MMNAKSVADHSRHVVWRLCDPYVIILILGTIRYPHAPERRQQRPVITKIH